MENQTPDTKRFLDLVANNEKMVAMVAPSFPIDFGYPEIIGMLKRLGFQYTVEVARGAVETNRELNELLQKNPDKKYISNPCPTIVRIIRRQFPELVQFLTKIDTPMSATAKIVAERFPGYKKVFIGPCIAKKLEAKEDYPELDILVLTYRELKQIFGIKGITPGANDELQAFDIESKQTRLYAISGGLAQSSCLTKNLFDPEYDVVSGIQSSEKHLRGFLANKELKVLDILACEGGCINGPGIEAKDPIEVRREKVVSYWDKIN